MKNMKASLLHSNGNRVNFTLEPGEYQNFMVFLYEHDIFFVSEMLLDFNKMPPNLNNIPFNLHGRGNSHNINEYLSNNNNDYNLIYNFLNYFISIVINIKYENGNNLIFFIIENEEWQNMKILIPRSTTTTTTTTIDPNNYVVTLSGNRIVTLSGKHIIV